LPPQVPPSSQEPSLSGICMTLNCVFHFISSPDSHYQFSEAMPCAS
jgi:hypothetical protein